MKTRGFTLIELLVVTSVISMIASIIMVPVQGARLKAKNSRIVSEVLQLRNAFEQNYTNGVYTDFGTNNQYNMPNLLNLTTSEQNIISDIVSQTPGSYYGGGVPVAALNGGCVDASHPLGQAITRYPADTGYGYPGPDYYKLTSIVITVSPACGPVTDYAIYAEYSPIFLGLEDNKLFKTAYAMAVSGPSANQMAGYYCVDSAGKSANQTQGWPGYYGTLSDGKCH